MKNDNGGAAFPVAAGPGQQFTQGMSLRDWFAGQAMQGILSDQTTVSAFDAAGKRDLIQPACLVATAAYAMADAMLAERNKEQGE